MSVGLPVGLRFSIRDPNVDVYSDDLWQQQHGAVQEPVIFGLLTVDVDMEENKHVEVCADIRRLGGPEKRFQVKHFDEVREKDWTENMFFKKRIAV